MKVSLNGTGGDEVFAGYRRYLSGGLAKRLINRMPGPIFSVASHTAPLFAETFATQSRLAGRDTVFRTAGGGALPTQIFVNRKHLRACLASVSSESKALIQDGATGPQAIMLFNYAVYLLYQLLLMLDQTAMASTMEGRVLLLDTDLITADYQMLLSWHVRGGKTKAAQKAIARRSVDGEVVDRRKQGSGEPQVRWVRQNPSAVRATIMGRQGLSPFASIDVSDYLDASLDRVPDHSLQAMCRMYCSLSWCKGVAVSAPRPEHSARCTRPAGAVLGEGMRAPASGLMTLPVAVVIPAHNCADQIDTCLRSVFQQTWAPAQVIVINDASQDGTGERLDAWDRPNLTLCRRETPGAGGYAARNLGVSLSRFPWIAFLDSDDAWEPFHLESLWRGLGAHPAVRFAATGRRDVCEGPGSSGALDLLTLKAQSDAELLDLARYVDYAANGLEPFLTSCVIMTRALFDQAGGFPESGFRRGGDADLWLRAMALTNTALRINRASCQYWKKRPGSVTAARANVRGAHPIRATAERLAAQIKDAETRRKLDTFAHEKQFRWLRENGGMHSRLEALKTVSFRKLTRRGKLKFAAFLTGASVLSALAKAIETKFYARRRAEAGKPEADTMPRGR